MEERNVLIAERDGLKEANRCLREMRDAWHSRAVAHQGNADALRASLDAANRRNEGLEKVVEAAKKLSETLHRIHDDPEYLAVWTHWQNHVGRYKGPEYTKPLDALDAALGGK